MGVDSFTAETSLVAFNYRFHWSPLSIRQSEPRFSKFRIEVERGSLRRQAYENQQERVENHLCRPREMHRGLYLNAAFLTPTCGKTSQMLESPSPPGVY